jgi:drug/metabolite transporter (DMT)-like permease
MIPPWIGFTLVAALFQCWRTALQQRLREELSINAAGVVRYLYGVPVGLALLTLYGLGTGEALPAMTAWAVALCAIGGFAQILGTNLLIMAFGYRNFAVGTAYSKTEAVQAAIVGALLLGERLSPLSWAGIAVGVAGVLYLSFAGRGNTLAGLLRGITSTFCRTSSSASQGSSA